MMISSFLLPPFFFSPLSLSSSAIERTDHHFSHFNTANRSPSSDRGSWRRPLRGLRGGGQERARVVRQIREHDDLHPAVAGHRFGFARADQRLGPGEADRTHAVG